VAATGWFVRAAIGDVVDGLLGSDEFRPVQLPALDRQEVRLAVRESSDELEASTVQEGRRAYQATAAAVLVDLAVIVVLVLFVREALDWFDPVTTEQVLAVVGVLALVGGAVAVSLWARSAWLRWYDRLRKLATPRLRLAVNEHVTAISPTELRVDRTPEQDDSWLLPRTEDARMRRLITDLGARTIAVSGPRGVGKTTLLRLEGEPGRQAVRVMVEANQDARDLVQRLSAQLCLAVLAAARDPNWRRSSRNVWILAWAVRIVCLLLAAALILHRGLRDTSDPNGQRIDDAIGKVLRPIGLSHDVPDWTLLLMLVGLAGLYVGAEFIRPARNRALAKQASAQLRRLRRLPDRTLPEVVAEYRELAGAVVEWRSGLVVAIDELDRIPDAETAERFIDRIRPVFGIPGVVYLVAVSEEVLARFERRVSDQGSGMDATFDDIIRLHEFGLDETLALLRRRVTGFPDLFLALCHCLSGGVPRDSVRAARALVDARREVGQNDIADITAGVVHYQLQTYRSGFLARPGADRLDTEFVGLVAEPGWPGTGPSLNAAVGTLLEPEFDAMDPARSELAAVVYYYATVLDVFGNRTEHVESALAGSTDVRREHLAQLAGVRGLIGLSPAMAIEQLNWLRRGFALAALTR
jgi:KAP family P-loop domain